MEDHFANARTKAMLHRLQTAMRSIEADIAANQGVYPFNHGRVTQSELCRRADVKKATLQTPLHKDTTRVKVLQWLEILSSQLLQTRDAVRQRITADSDLLTLEVQRLRQELALANLKVEALTQENADFRKQLGLA